MESVDRPIWRSRAWPAVVTVMAAMVLPLAVVGPGGRSAVVVPLVVITLAVGVTIWALTRARTQRRAHEDRLTAWAAERAAHAERLRIARDLHDLVSHGLGLITVRAAAARIMREPDGHAERASALADIETVSRETTTELRRMLTLLRTPDDQPAPLRPADTLADLPGIVERARATGLTVTLDHEDVEHASPGVQLAVCALVREALANTVRHAGPTTAHVRAYRDGARIVISVDDDGPVPGWRSRPGVGHGLTGLRERVTALGGALDTVPLDGGFRLTARLPDPERP